MFSVLCGLLYLQTLLRPDGVQPCGRHVAGGDAAHWAAAGQTWRWGLCEVSACSDKQVSPQCEVSACSDKHVSPSVRCQPAVINRSVPGHQMVIKGLAVCWDFYASKCFSPSFSISILPGYHQEWIPIWGPSVRTCCTLCRSSEEKSTFFRRLKTGEFKVFLVCSILM